MKNKKQFLQHKTQQGVVLIWAVVFLLVITILGLGAIRMSGIDTQIAGNSMMNMLVFQSAESTMGRVAQYKYIDVVSKQMGAKYSVPAINLPLENNGGGGQATVVSSATVQYEAGLNTEIKCPPNMANSSKLPCIVFRIETESRVAGSNVKSKHVMGWAEIKPKTSK